ncbi:MAG: ABC transporter substrate-binding protein [Polyangiales bacterium]
MILTYDGVVASALDFPGVQPLPRHALGDIMRRGGYDAARMEARRTRVLPLDGPRPRRVVHGRARGKPCSRRTRTPTWPRAPIRRVELHCDADHAALIGAFERGELDLIAPSALSAVEADALGARLPSAVLQRPSNQLYALQPDPAVPMLQRLAVREALLQGIDREALSRALFGDEGRVADAPTPEATVQGARRVELRRRARSRVLTREGVVGQTLRLTHGNGAIERAASEIIATAWRSLGLQVDVRVGAPRSRRS